ncbi:helix-turn-helix domain-containing protein [Streptomyces asoensis]|uniref:helix-turn-helix domain-containing protein n=1 Tax=Streptomyces asoensis TaxID=249586 RepID=UPI00367F2CDC
MGRPEAPIDFTVPALGSLAQYLRIMRRTAGLTYSELAERVDYSAAHLKRAASGAKLPTLEVALAYVRGCVNDDSDKWPSWTILELHLHASEAVERAAREKRRSTVVPKPQYARDLADLSGAMRDAWKRSGRPSARVMESHTLGQLPRSTANVIANGHTVPRDFRQYVGFLLACEVDGLALQEWFRAWFKVIGKPGVDAAVSCLRSLSGIGDRKAYLDAYADGEAVPEVLRNELTHTPVRKMLTNFPRMTPVSEEALAELTHGFAKRPSSATNAQRGPAQRQRAFEGFLADQPGVVLRIIKAPTGAAKSLAGMATAQRALAGSRQPEVHVLQMPGAGGGRVVLLGQRSGIPDLDAAALLNTMENEAA